MKSEAGQGIISTNHTYEHDKYSGSYFNRPQHAKMDIVNMYFKGKYNFVLILCQERLFEKTQSI